MIGLLLFIIILQVAVLWRLYELTEHVLELGRCVLVLQEHAKKVGRKVLRGQR